MIRIDECVLTANCLNDQSDYLSYQALLYTTPHNLSRGYVDNQIIKKMDIFIISLINALFLMIGIIIGSLRKDAISSNYERLAHTLKDTGRPKIKIFNKAEVKSVEEQQLKDIDKHYEQDRVQG